MLKRITNENKGKDKTRWSRRPKEWKLLSHEQQSSVLVGEGAQKWRHMIGNFSFLRFSNIVWYGFLIVMVPIEKPWNKCFWKKIHRKQRSTVSRTHHTYMIRCILMIFQCTAHIGSTRNDEPRKRIIFLYKNRSMCTEEKRSKNWLVIYMKGLGSFHIQLQVS